MDLVLMHKPHQQSYPNSQAKRATQSAASSTLVLFWDTHLLLLNHLSEDYASLHCHQVSLQAHLLRINMGNIYFEQQKYPAAIKMYRMALDQVPLTSRSVRSKILRNIGVAFMRVGQYQVSSLCFCATFIMIQGS